jgi:hypothetical protein
MAGLEVTICAIFLEVLDSNLRRDADYFPQTLLENTLIRTWLKKTEGPTLVGEVSANVCS